MKFIEPKMICDFPDGCRCDGHTNLFHVTYNSEACSCLARPIHVRKSNDPLTKEDEGREVEIVFSRRPSQFSCVSNVEQMTVTELMMLRVKITHFLRRRYGVTDV